MNLKITMYCQEWSSMAASSRMSIRDWFLSCYSLNYRNTCLAITNAQHKWSIVSQEQLTPISTKDKLLICPHSYSTISVLAESTTVVNELKKKWRDPLGDAWRQRNTLLTS